MSTHTLTASPIDILNECVGHLAQQGDAIASFIIERGKAFVQERKRKPSLEINPLTSSKYLAFDSKHYRYFEGYALRKDSEASEFARHAWCVHKDGRVVDLAWEKEGVAYIGIAVPDDLFRTTEWDEWCLDEDALATIAPALG